MVRLDLGSFPAQGFKRAGAISLISGIRDLIRARLARVSQPGLSLLATGAVLGKGFSFQHAASIAGQERGEWSGARQSSPY